MDSQDTSTKVLRYLGFVTDICDSIVSVSGLSRAFCGELVRFNGATGDVTGFV